MERNMVACLDVVNVQINLLDLFQLCCKVIRAIMASVNNLKRPYFPAAHWQLWLSYEMYNLKFSLYCILQKTTISIILLLSSFSSWNLRIIYDSEVLCCR